MQTHYKDLLENKNPLNDQEVLNTWRNLFLLLILDNVLNKDIMFVFVYFVRTSLCFQTELFFIPLYTLCLTFDY